MKIHIAKTAGFCMGVRRAVEMALDAPTKNQKPIYTFGPLIHNPQVLALFAEKGITILDHIPSKGSGTVLIRAHGVPPTKKKALKKAGFSVIDATCPRVVKVQSIIKRHAHKGYATIIVGDEDHPEVTGLLGFAGERRCVAAKMDALDTLPDFEQAVIVAQTTQNQHFYQQIKDWAAQYHPHYLVFDTICDSTEKRQAEVRQLADTVDTVIVVGGKDSGNTQRLAEVVRSSGKPAFHIETEDELDTKVLSTVQTIGITAGASTPSWIIKRVLMAASRLDLRHGHGWRAFSFKLIRFLLLTNIYVALGAGCLCYTASHLQGITVQYPAVSVAVLYVISMHILNHLTGRAEDKYNDPDREKFYQRHKWLLTIMAIVAGAFGLVAAFKMGVLPFWVLLTMSILGLSYNLRIMPDNLLPHLKFRRIRDLPGSKTILIALAWGVATAGIPAMASEQSNWFSGLLVFAGATGIVFGRTAFFDILDMQGDRIVGKETIPIIWGQKRSFLLVKSVLAAIAVVMPIIAIIDLLTPLAYVLVLCPLLLLNIISAHEHGNMQPGMRLEFLIESLFVLSGLITFIYAVFLTQ